MKPIKNIDNLDKVVDRVENYNKEEKERNIPVLWVVLGLIIMLILFVWIILPWIILVFSITGY